MTLRKAAQQALDALVESVDLVRHDYVTDWRHGMPTRKNQLDACKDALDAHVDAIDALRAALESCRKCGGPIHPNFPCEEMMAFDADPADKHPTQTEVKPVAWTSFPTGEQDWLFMSGAENPNGKLLGRWVPLYLRPQDNDDLYAAWKHGFESGRMEK